MDASRAADYLRSALERLRTLDDTLDSDDTYPLVTMAEGHTKALAAIDGKSVARIKAREYAEILERRQNKSPDPRLQRAYEKLFKFASTGTWTEDDNGAVF